VLQRLAEFARERRIAGEGDEVEVEARSADTFLDCSPGTIQAGRGLLISGWGA